MIMVGDMVIMILAWTKNDACLAKLLMNQSPNNLITAATRAVNQLFDYQVIAILIDYFNYQFN
jgi:hypothetical protein